MTASFFQMLITSSIHGLLTKQRHKVAKKSLKWLNPFTFTAPILGLMSRLYEEQSRSSTTRGWRVISSNQMIASASWFPTSTTTNFDNCLIFQGVMIFINIMLVSFVVNSSMTTCHKQSSGHKNSSRAFRIMASPKTKSSKSLMQKMKTSQEYWIKPVKRSLWTVNKVVKLWYCSFMLAGVLPKTA